MKTPDIATLSAKLAECGTEEEVKSVYARALGLRYDTKDDHDLYTPQVLFEFKFDRNFASLKIRATVLAQILYYVRRLKFGESSKAVPFYLCLADVNEALVTETTVWKEYYTDAAEKYDWDLSPSFPDARLVADLQKHKQLRNLHVYDFRKAGEFAAFLERIGQCLDPQQTLLGDKKVITEDNFEEVFAYWNSMFGDAVRNGKKTSRYFVCDMQQGRTHLVPHENKLFFDLGNNESSVKKILLKDYEYFWNLYEKVTDAALVRSVLTKIDRLTDETMRRFHGEFFTPVPFARKGLDYLEKTLGREWWKGNVRIWDMAAGTGNLEWHLPTGAYDKLYLSTLYVEDVEHCRRLFPAATVFQYDYLNDDVGNLFSSAALQGTITWKLPEKLRQDLANPDVHWVIFINPPFATSQKHSKSGESKTGVSDTEVRKKMHADDLGEVSRELFAQFLYRIKNEFKGKSAHLGLYSTLKYLNANNDQKFRDTVFHFDFVRGFTFSSANFSGTSRTSPFPVGFLIWNLAEKKRIEEQTVVLDVFDEQVRKTGRKRVQTENRERFLNKWIERPKADIVFPPFGSAIGLKTDAKDPRDRISEGFIGSLMCKGNDFQNQNFTALLSGPYVSAGALSITPDNFSQAMVVHAVRRLPEATWMNDRDQFMQPNGELADEFVNDCAVWSLFSLSNQTVSMKDVEYKGNVYQIANQFFPYCRTEMKKWQVSDSDIAMSLTSADADRFVAIWLARQKLSAEAEELLALGREYYALFYAQLNNLATPKFKIATWDAGWWQIRRALEDQTLGNDLLKRIKAKHVVLRGKLLPQLVDYGFISA